MNIIKSTNYFTYTNEQLFKNNKSIIKFVNQLKEIKYTIPFEIINIILNMIYNKSFYTIQFNINELANMSTYEQFSFLCFWIKKKYPNFIFRFCIKNKFDYNLYQPINIQLTNNIKNNYILQFQENSTIKQIQQKILLFLKLIFIKGYENETNN